MKPVIEKLDAVLGAQVSGVDLREDLAPDTVSTLREALFAHQVLFFRDQALDDEQHLAFARNFGRPLVFPVVEMLGSDVPLEFVLDDEQNKSKADYWHTDITWLPDPPKLGVLSAQVIPETGGDTLWCSLYSIYEDLSAEQRERIAQLVVEHRPGPAFFDAVLGRLGDDFMARFRARYGDGAQHPLCRNHYVTERPLVYLAGGFMHEVVDWERDASRELIRELMAIADRPKHQIRWRWRENDVAIWDERSTMHQVDSDHWPQKRLMRRCTLG